MLSPHYSLIRFRDCVNPAVGGRAGMESQIFGYPIQCSCLRGVLPAFFCIALSESGVSLPILSLFLSSERNRYGKNSSIWTLSALSVFISTGRERWWLSSPQSFPMVCSYAWRKMTKDHKNTVKMASREPLHL